FDLWELSGRLAIAHRDRGALFEAIRRAPTVVAPAGTPDEVPWRVVVTCPEPEGTPPVNHDVVFVGGGSVPEAAVVHGTPVDARDAALERDAGADLAPASALART